MSSQETSHVNRDIRPLRGSYIQEKQRVLQQLRVADATHRELQNALGINDDIKFRDILWELTIDGHVKREMDNSGKRYYSRGHSMPVRQLEVTRHDD